MPKAAVKVSRLSRAARLTDEGVTLLAARVPQAPTERAAAGFGVSRRCLGRVQAGEPVKPATQEKIAAGLGRSVAELFAVSELDRAVADRVANQRAAVEELIAETVRFDPVDTSAMRLRSQKREDRGALLTALKGMLAAVQLLEDDPSLATSETIANYYLTLGDQCILAEDPQDVSLAPVFIDRAVTAAASTRNFALRATSLLHRASTHYSAGRYAAAKADRAMAKACINSIPTGPVRRALSVRLAGDRARQMIEEGGAAEAVMNGVIRDATGLDDACMLGSNLSHLGIQQLRDRDPQAAARQLDTSIATFAMSRSKNKPLQLAITTKWRALAEMACHGRGAAEQFWSDAKAICTDFGFAHQLARVRRLRTEVDEFGNPREST